MFGHQKRIQDALNQASGVSVRQELKLTDTQVYTRKELYELRDRSGLARQQFYLKRFEQIEIIEKVEVGNV